MGGHFANRAPESEAPFGIAFRLRVDNECNRPPVGLVHGFEVCDYWWRSCR
jgi:hypothetical protein